MTNCVLTVSDGELDVGDDDGVWEMTKTCRRSLPEAREGLGKSYRWTEEGRVMNRTCELPAPDYKHPGTAGSCWEEGEPGTPL